MNDINEVVDLPAADTKPLLHPIDVAPARKSYLTSWWLSRLASLPVAFLFAVLLWRTSGNVITPTLVPLLVLVIAALAGQYFAGQAWAHIPRNRQDHQRKQGAVLHIAATLIDAIALVSGLLVLLAWTSARDLSDDVEAFAIGAGAGIALLQLAEVTAAAARPSRDWMVVATQSLFLAAVTSTVLVAATTLVGDDWDTKAITVASCGAGTMILIQITWWIVGSRRPRSTGANGAAARRATSADR